MAFEPVKFCSSKDCRTKFLRCKLPTFNFLSRNQILNVLNHTHWHSGKNPPPLTKISHKTSISDVIHRFNTDFTITPQVRRRFPFTPPAMISAYSCTKSFQKYPYQGPFHHLELSGRTLQTCSTTWSRWFHPSNTPQDVIQLRLPFTNNWEANLKEDFLDLRGRGDVRVRSNLYTVRLGWCQTNNIVGSCTFTFLCQLPKEEKF